MKKVFALENLDCANCAAKMERAILKIEGVSAATVSFFAQKLILEVDDSRFEEITEQCAKAIAKVDSDCKLVRK